MPELKPLLATLGLANPVAVFSVLLDAVVHRAELASTEATIARDTLARIILMSLAAFAFFLLTGFAGTFALAAAVWDHPHREVILLGVTAAYAATSLGLFLWSVRMLRSWSPLKETCQQLRRDEAFLKNWLGGANTSNPPSHG